MSTHHVRVVHKVNVNRGCVDTRSHKVHVHLVRSPLARLLDSAAARPYVLRHAAVTNVMSWEGQCFTPQLAVGCVDGPERTSGVAMTVRFNLRHPDGGSTQDIDDGAAELFTNPLIH